MRAHPMLCVLVLLAAPISSGAAVRGPGDGSGPRLDPITNRPAPNDAVALRGLETYVDVVADVFTPGKANPSQWMSTSTLVRYTTDGYTYQYGYDPLAQSYDLVVSGYAVPPGILAQETVGAMAVRLPASLPDGQIERVEIWFTVKDHNLFPDEYIGITALEGTIPPKSSLDVFDMQRLYDDARGFTGEVYALEHFGAGAHAIDLGPLAAAHANLRLAREGWFGVGFGADGWDLSQSLGVQVYWSLAGGGALPLSRRPFFRFVYNAPPDPFALLGPDDGAKVGDPRPLLRWQAATDPNLDAPILYTVRLGSEPSLASPLSFDAGSAQSALPPLPLAPGPVYWEVVARDPKGATRTSARRSFTVVQATDAPDAPRDLALAARPNPFNPRTRATLSVSVPQPVRLEVHDARGRLVRTLHSGGLTAGEHQWDWDGRDAAGRPCASGVYTLRATAAVEGTRTLRLTLVR